MLFIQSFSLVLSTLIFIFISNYSYKNRKVPGAYIFFILMIAALIWNLGSFCELHSTTLWSKVFWRDVQQLGTFGMPIGTLFFTVIYTRQTKLMKYAIIAAIPDVIAVLLIFTNELHNLVRSGYTLESSEAYGQSLIVHSTTLGSILVAYNFALPIIAVALLIYQVRRVSPGFRKQIYTIILSFLYTFFVAWIKTAVLDPIGVYIHISALYAPAAVLMFFSVFKHNTLSLSPIARDKVFEVIDQGIMVLDESGTVLDINSSALNTLQEYFSIRNPLGTMLKDFNFQYPYINDYIGNVNEQQAEIHIQSDNKDAYISLHYYPLFQNDEKYIGSVMIINNITVQKIFERNLKDKAEKDYLTRFLNKFGFQKALQKYLESGNIQRYSVMMIDLDNFKQINDTYGHAAGDSVLRNFTDIVNSIIRSEDIAGRLGGDEFVIVVPSISKNTTLRIAERIRKSVESAEIDLDHQKTNYTISIGIADNRNASLCFDDILKRADAALYQAKKMSRNCSVVYSETE